MLQRYHLNGILLESTAVLPTLPSSDEGARPTLRFDLLSSAPPEPLGGWAVLYEITRPLSTEPVALVARQGDHVLLRFLETADFVISVDGKSIACTPAPECPGEVVEQLLVDQVIPRALYLRGQPALHGSAVQLADAGAVAFVGTTGRGKSTLCAAFAHSGGAAVCDDCLSVVFGASGARVLPSYPSLRLWPDTSDALFPSGKLPVVSPWTSKRRFKTAGANGTPPLLAMFVLAPGSEPPEITTLTSREAFATLAALVHRLDVQAPAALHAEFSLLTEIVARVPVARLAFEQRFDYLERLMALVRGFAASVASAA